jgi:hypothetical protein
MIILVEKRMPEFRQSRLGLGDLTITPSKDAVKELKRTGEVWFAIDRNGKRLHLYGVNVKQVELSPRLKKYIQTAEEMDEDVFDNPYWIFVFLGFPGLAKSPVEFVGSLKHSGELPQLIKFAWG